MCVSGLGEESGEYEEEDNGEAYEEEDYDEDDDDGNESDEEYEDEDEQQQLPEEGIETTLPVAGGKRATALFPKFLFLGKFFSSSEIYF